MSATPSITLYTDGACIDNPGPGGYGVVLLSGPHRKELSGGFRRTTNNRMEVMAAIVGLEALKRPSTVLVYSDSAYLVETMASGVVHRWRARGWMRSATKPTLNADLWARMLEVCAPHTIRWEWIRGHAGTRENERCDALSMQAARQANLPADAGYEQAPERPETPSLFDLA